VCRRSESSSFSKVLPSSWLCNPPASAHTYAVYSQADGQQDTAEAEASYRMHSCSGGRQHAAPDAKRDRGVRPDIDPGPPPVLYKVGGSRADETGAAAAMLMMHGRDPGPHNHDRDQRSMLEAGSPSKSWPEVDPCG